MLININIGASRLLPLKVRKLTTGQLEQKQTILSANNATLLK